jgi:hypothetical protein
MGTAPPARPWRALPLALFVLLSLGALAFDLSQRARLPGSGDWAELAAFLRTQGRPGDAVQLWPVWLERARMVLDLPVLAEEELATADYPGVERLWLLSLPGPYAGVGKAEAQLAARGATKLSGPRQFGPLSLQAFDLHAPPLAGDLLARGPFALPWPEFHEVQYVARRCRMVPLGTPEAPALISVRGEAGKRLHLRAGIIGEQAYGFGSTVTVDALAEGTEAPLARAVVRPSRDPVPAWEQTDADVPPGPAERAFTLRISTPGGQRPPLCVSLWTTR